MMLILFLVSFVATTTAVNVTCKRVSQTPLISGRGAPYRGQSNSETFDYTYNAAVIPASPSFPHGGSLLVRCQNNASSQVDDSNLNYYQYRSDDGNPRRRFAGDRFAATPSVIAFSRANSEHAGSGSSSTNSVFGFTAPESSTVVLSPATSPLSDFGTEDPRVTLVPGLGYYLFYTAAQSYRNGTVVARLSLAVCRSDPSEASCWRAGVLGPVFPSIGWSKSGAFFVDEATGAGHLVFGDSVLQYAVSTNADHTAFRIVNSTFVSPREGMFDAGLVEAGPAPMRLPSGNWLFFYNSARHGFPSPKPGYDYQYNVGYLVLDGADPSRILHRSAHPVLSPVLDWEIGISPVPALTPRVVFVEGAWRDANDEYVVVYGAADTYIGAARCSVVEKK